MRQPILATGLSGLVGSRIQELLEDRFDFTDLSLTSGVDITDSESVEKHIQNSEAKIILHMAAKTDVDGCEEDKILGEEGAAWLVNVVGTENIVDSAQKTGKKVIYISTDFVFDGTKESYREEDEPNPVNWYGYTKYEGEQLVSRLGASGAIVRIAYPYRAEYTPKKDFLRRILEKLRNGEQLQGVTDHIFTPTFIDDIAQALLVLFQKDITGIYHVVGSQSLSVYAAIARIADIFGFENDIQAVTREKYFRQKAFRPSKLALKNDRIGKLGVKMKTFEEGLLEIKRHVSI